jgi:hypothetical protein
MGAKSAADDKLFKALMHELEHSSLPDKALDRLCRRWTREVRRRIDELKRHDPKWREPK